MLFKLERRNWTVYNLDHGGELGGVCFHLGEPNEYHLVAVDALILSWNMRIDRPAPCGLEAEEIARGLLLKYALAEIVRVWTGIAADINIWREAKWALENGATPDQYEKILRTIQEIYNGAGSPLPYWRLVADALIRDEG